MSSVLTSRACRTANSSSPKSSPTGPTTRVSAKKLEASAKCTAEPPSSRSRLPACVSTASNAMEPTTVTLAIGRGRVPCRPVRAIRIAEWGGPEVLRLVEDAPEPRPADDEVLVRVTRAGVNFADTHASENAYVARYSLPLVPGAEVAGVLEDGTRVVALTGGRGGYAELAAVPREHVVPIPDGVGDGEALAILLQGLTAWHLYRTAGRVAAGESVVVVSGA